VILTTKPLIDERGYVLANEVWIAIGTGTGTGVPDALDPLIRMMNTEVDEVLG
jgi:energy-converting hydrogenase Eha subunit E